VIGCFGGEQVCTVCRHGKDLPRPPKVYLLAEIRYARSVATVAFLAAEFGDFRDRVMPEADAAGVPYVRPPERYGLEK
jgi:hypothetical protein